MHDGDAFGGDLHGGDGHVVDEPDELLEFSCPRCAREVQEALYGPCTSCRTTLRALISAEAREVAQADYEPKMNVTPNAVASKE